MEAQSSTRSTSGDESLESPKGAPTSLEKAALMRLVLEWEQSARSQFQCAERTTDPMGKRLVEHGATCYFNCAQSLRKYLYGS